LSDIYETPPISYTSREFSTIKADLVSYAKRYYPDTMADFSEASFGAMMIDMVAYVGDVLSFYVDYQANESFLDTAIEYNNIFRLARQVGYKPSRSFTSTGEVTLYIIIPSRGTGRGTGPDMSYAPILKNGSKFISSGGVIFTLTEDIDFSDPSNEMVVASSNPTTGVPISYAIKSFGRLVSGEYRIEYVPVGEFMRYPRFVLADRNIVEVISVTDAQGNKYYEVDHLSQDIVYENVKNTGSDKNLAPYIVKPKPVPRRYTVEMVGASTFLQFGHGSDKNLTNEKITDPSKVVLQQHAKNYITDKTFDPTRLLETDKLGVAPSNTTLTVIYRSNTANNVNIATNALTETSDIEFSFNNISSLVSSEVANVISSLDFENERPIVGDTTIPDVEEIRNRALGYYSSQNRAVTRQDYISLIYNMHPKFGSVKRAAMYQDTNSFKRNLNLYVLSENAAGNLVQSPSTIKNNLKAWLTRYKMINDTIDILDAKVVNLAIEYEAMIDREENKFGALDIINSRLSAYYSNKFDIGEPFMLSDIYSVLKEIPFVLDVRDIKVSLQTGAQYSNTSFDIKRNTSSDGRLIACPNDHIFEIRFPSSDIRGTIV
jgi:hypothetical protein